jgi:hypothetical protein
MRYAAYVGRASELRGSLGGLPGWGRALVAIAAVPGIVLGLLSLVLLVVSLLALLVLTVPMYRLVRGISGEGRDPTPEPRHSKPVQVRVLDGAEHA